MNLIILDDLKFHNLTLTEAINMAQNRLLWGLLATVYWFA